MEHPDNSVTRDLVERVAGGVRFQRSPRLREFLLLVCHHRLEQGAAPLHEQEIGRRVYARREDYNPGDDNIVRVEARRLRKELEAYFAEEGRDEPVIITIPKGTYLPSFEPRPADAGGSATQPAASLREPVGAGFPGRSGWRPIAGVVLLAATAFAAGWLLAGRSAAVLQMSRKASTGPFGVWPALLNPAHRTMVVVGDGALALFEDLSRREVALAEYPNDYARRAGSSDLEMVASRHLAGLAGVLIVTRMLQSEGCPRSTIVVRHARDLSPRDFQSDQHILIGSRNSNPWGDLFREKRNFLPKPGWHTGSAGYVNLKPLPGEPAVFDATGAGSEHFGVVAYLPNLKSTDNVLVIEGTSMAATEAAWEFLNDAARFPAFVRQRRLERPGGKVAYFEAILKTTSVAGTPQATEYVAHREIAGN